MLLSMTVYQDVVVVLIFIFAVAVIKCFMIGVNV